MTTTCMLNIYRISVAAAARGHETGSVLTFTLVADVICFCAYRFPCLSPVSALFYTFLSFVCVQTLRCRHLYIAYTSRVCWDLQYQQAVITEAASVWEQSACWVIATKSTRGSMALLHPALTQMDQHELFQKLSKFKKNRSEFVLLKCRCYEILKYLI